MSDDGTFQKVSQDSEKKMYGPRAVLVCGHSSEEQARLKEMLSSMELPIIVAHDHDLDTPVGELITRPDGTGVGTDSGTDRLVLLSGITQAELYKIMNNYRGLEFKRPLWAALTPTSEKWTLRALLTELKAEQEAIEQQRSGDEPGD